MDKRLRQAMPFVIVAMVCIAVLLIVPVLFNPPQVDAAFTTPVASWPHSTDNSKWPIYFWVTEVLTQSGASEEYKLMNYEALDLHYIIDVGTVNTTTIKLQYSNDGTNWADGANVVANVNSDKNVIDQFYNVGAYTRLYATLTNNNPITITVIGLAK